MMRSILITFALLGACTTTYDVDRVSAGAPETGGRVLHAKTSSQFVRGVYADLLGRTPTSYDFELDVNGSAALTIPLDEEPMLVGVLDGVGDGLPIRNLLVIGLLHSAELTLPAKSAVADARTYIHDQFTKLLGREPNVYELETFAKAWESDPAVGPRAVIRAITGSREYQGH
jgi:hypothetical protein